MSTLTILEEIKSFLDINVAKKIKFQKADDNNVNNYGLTHPNVFIGWIPPEGYLPENMETVIPCIVVGVDDGTDDSEDSQYKIKLSFAVYSPGEHVAIDDEVKYTPSFQGYIDLLNFIDLAKAALIKNTIINNKFAIVSACKWGMYVDQPYPYWYGWLTFTAKSKAYPKTDIEKMLLER